jgi:hypothetical protein
MPLADGHGASQAELVLAGTGGRLAGVPNNPRRGLRCHTATVLARTLPAGTLLPPWKP